MKIIDTSTNETVCEIMTNHSMTLDEAISFAGRVDPEAEDENVCIDGIWYYYEDLAIIF